MTGDKKLLEVLISINAIFNDEGLELDQKLQHVLHEIVRCVPAKRASIMLMKGLKSLEVVASTNTELIGVKQRLDEESPSAWVIKHRAPLYVDNIANSDIFQKRFDHYKGDAFFLVPLIGNKKVIGVLSVTDKMGEDIFSREEQKALLNIVGQLISAFENQRLKRKSRTLQQKNLRLRKLERLKTELFNMLIHDLKGPISELISNLDILSYTLSGENLGYVESAESACNTLYRMVSNLLDIARFEEDRLELIYEKIDPQGLIKESLAGLFGLVKMKELTFVEKAPSLKTMDSFWGDRGILLRILQNLLTNAINYSPLGETIEVGFEYLKSSEIEFFVKDNGPGVSPEYQEVIFNKYFQLEKKNDGRIYTTGLGLTFCKMAVEVHRGKIGVESDSPIKGSRFFFSLPLDNQSQN